MCIPQPIATSASFSRAACINSRLRTLVSAFCLATFCLLPLGFAEEDELFEDLRGDVELSQETLDQAEDAFFSGFEAYRKKSYKKAADLFKKAHALVPNRDLLFNIARSFEQLGDQAQAISFYQKYLQTKPIDETQIIHRLRQFGVGEIEVAAPKQTPSSPLSPQDRYPKDEEKGSSTDWLSWAVLGGGVALIGTGSYFGLNALDEAEAARTASSSDAYGRHKSDAESAALIADITLILGAAAVAGGVFLWLTQDTSPELDAKVESAQAHKTEKISSTIRWNFNASPDHATIGFSGHF